MKVHLKHVKVTQNMHGASKNYRYVWDVSLPPSYGDYVHNYVGRGANMSLQNFMTDLLAADVAPIEDAEVLDGEGIYLI